jgi:hypothetical protein
MRELNLNYWERLKHLALYSLEERRERYIIQYTWKVLTGLAPNLESETSRIVTRYRERRGDCARFPHLITEPRPGYRLSVKDHFPLKDRGSLMPCQKSLEEGSSSLQLSRDDWTIGLERSRILH